MIDLIEKERLDSNLNNRNDLYSTIIKIGKKGLKEYLPKIEKFLNDTDLVVKQAAIRTLTNYWKIEKYKDYAKKIFFEEPDEDLKAYALDGWSSYYRKQNNKELLVVLEKVIVDRAEPLIVRATAYQCFFYCSKLKPTEWPDTDLDWDNFDKGIDREALNKVLSSD